MVAGESVTMRVVRTVADREGVDPAELDPPLHSVIDTDALDALFPSTARRENGASGSVEFVYRGHTVRVESSGDVHVGETAPSAGTGTRSSTDSIRE